MHLINYKPLYDLPAQLSVEGRERIWAMHLTCKSTTKELYTSVGEQEGFRTTKVYSSGYFLMWWLNNMKWCKWCKSRNLGGWLTGKEKLRVQSLCSSFEGSKVFFLNIKYCTMVNVYKNCYTSCTCLYSNLHISHP